MVKFYTYQSLFTHPLDPLLKLMLIYFKDHLQTEDFNSYIKLKKLQKEAGNKKKYYARIAKVKEDYLRFIVSSYSKKGKE